MISDSSAQASVEDEVFIFPASFAQQRLWFIEQLLPNQALYIIPLVFRLTGTLQRSHLVSSLQAIVDRHEILRTTFDVVEGQLVQIIAPASPLLCKLTDLQALPQRECEDTAIAQIWQEIQQPFHLNQGSLFRVHLWRLQTTEHLLLLAMHHIIFDEWSSGVLIRELSSEYAARVAGRTGTVLSALPDLPFQYADFAHWQRQWLQGEVLETQLRYWKQQLQDVPVLTLPGVISRPSDPSHSGASQLLELPQSLLEALEALSQQAGVTLFMTLLAAFQALLHRYTGQTDLAIGSPIANRHRSELEGLIGFLVNSLVLRTSLAGDPTFRELLERVRSVTLAAYAHQDLPFEKLVEELQPVRNLGQNPLFQVVFALQNTPMEQLALPGLVLSPVQLETQTARFDLELYLWKCADNFRNLWGEGWQRSDGLRGMIVYNTALFDTATITWLLHHFQTLLAGIVANPEAAISALPLLKPSEQQQRWHQWQQRQQHWYPPPSSEPTLCIHQWFEAQARQRPQAIVIQFGAQSFTYQQLNQGSNQLARYLRRAGVGPGVCVGICLDQGVQAIASMLAILKAGAAYVPLDPSYPLERLHWMVKDAGISVVLTQGGMALPMGRAICLEQEWDAIAQESDQNLSISGTAEQLAYVIYTSGSTGTPKGVMVPHRAVIRLVRQTNYVQIQADDRMAQVANLAFDAATFEVWGALLNGAQLIGIDRETALSPTHFVAALQVQGISILFLTTALLNQTVSQIPAGFKRLKYLLFGGELVNVDRVRSLVQQGKPDHLLHVYGPTENTTFSTWYEIRQVPEAATTIPIGQPIAQTQVYLLDSHQKPVPTEVIGEIYLGGAGLAQGYLNRPELTTERFISLSIHRESGSFSDPISAQAIEPTIELYKTGDWALYRADGNLEFLGRADHQIKIRGFRVELGEIEATIAQHPAVQTAVVMVREIDAAETLRDRQLVAYVVPKATLQTQELRSWLKAKLPVYMLPAVFVVLDKLPLTANGKVDRLALPPPPLSDLASDQRTSPIAPTTSLESSLVQLWTQLLGRAQVGIHDNFFELGGHSLLATQFVSRIRDRFQVELPLRAVFETPTIAQLAAIIAALSQAVEQQCLHDLQTSDLPMRDLLQTSDLAMRDSGLQRREEVEL